MRVAGIPEKSLLDLSGFKVYRLSNVVMGDMDLNTYIATPSDRFDRYDSAGFIDNLDRFFIIDVPHDGVTIHQDGRWDSKLVEYIGRLIWLFNVLDVLPVTEVYLRRVYLEVLDGDVRSIRCVAMIDSNEYYLDHYIRTRNGEPVFEYILLKDYEYVPTLPTYFMYRGMLLEISQWRYSLDRFTIIDETIKYSRVEVSNTVRVGGIV